MGRFVAAYDRGDRQKYPPSSKFATHSTMKKLNTVIPYLKKTQIYIYIYINHVTHILSSASISNISLEIGNFHYVRKYRFRSHFNT